MKFFIKSKKNEGRVTLFFEVNKRTPKFKAQINSFVPVDIQKWTRAQTSAKELQKYMQTAEGAKVMQTLQAIENAVNDLFVSGVIRGTEDKQIIIDAVSSIAFAEERETERIQEQHRREDEERKREEYRNRYRDIVAFYDYYFEGVKNGTFKQSDGRGYTNNTIMTWRTFGNELREFMETRHERNFDDITPTFCRAFSHFLESKGNMTSTINLMVGRFSTLCRLASKEGYNTNAVSLQAWESHTATKREKKTAVYLNEDEIQSLYEFPLKGNKAIIRDLFVFGVLTSQRFSDFSRVTRNWVEVEDGVTYLHFNQKKTGREMYVPLLDPRELEILERYNYTFPKVTHVTFNRRIKDILQELAKDVESLNEPFETLLSFKERLKEGNEGKTETIKKKWELVSSHTARRSGVTQMYKAGFLDKREMMAISGHATEKIFEDYIKLGLKEQAHRIAEKMMNKNTTTTKEKIG